MGSGEKGYFKRLVPLTMFGDESASDELIDGLLHRGLKSLYFLATGIRFHRREIDDI
jgi:hypothetical protein